MKKALLFLLLFASITCHSQEYFEGIIKFKIKLKDKRGQMPEAQAREYIGTEQTYYLKGDNYKSVLNGLLEMTTYYNGKDTIFMKLKDNNNLIYSLSSKEEEKVISYEFKNTDVTFLGYKCELLEVKTNKGFHKYYFNRNIKLNPKDYKNHKAGLWHFFLEKTGGAISLKTSADLIDSYNSIEVISIQKKVLDKAIFVRPDLPLLKLPE